MTVEKQLALICIIGIALFIILTLYAKRLKLVIKAFMRSVLGFFGLIAVNYAGQYIGISLGLNILNSVILGLLGLPGLCVLLVLQWLY